MAYKRRYSVKSLLLPGHEKSHRPELYWRYVVVGGGGRWPKYESGYYQDPMQAQYHADVMNKTGQPPRW